MIFATDDAGNLLPLFAVAFAAVMLRVLQTMALWGWR